MNLVDANLRIVNVMREWEKTCLIPFLENRTELDGNERNLSSPYCAFVNEEYIKSNVKVMVVGQEVLDFPAYRDGWGIEDIQQWAKDYFASQVYGNEKYENNPSAFWRFINMLDRQRCGVVWNNVDVVHQRILDSNGKYRTESLTNVIRRCLNSPFGSEGKTLFQYELEIIKPDIVVFITGPYYKESMECALNIQTGILDEYRPYSREGYLIRNISSPSKLRTKTLWTYHPSYLNRNEKKKGYLTKVAAYINSQIENYENLAR